MKPHWLGLLAVTALAVGCAKASTESEIKTDGTWSRTLKLTVSKQMEDKVPPIASVFEPPKGSAWKIAEEVKDDARTLTASRDFKIGDPPMTDIIVKEKEGVKMRNSVRVVELRPGVFEYTETFTWEGKQKTDPEKEKASIRDEIAKALPSNVDAKTVDAMAAETFRSVWKLMFGPGDPMLLTILTNPDYASKKIKTRISKSLDEIFARNLPNMPEAERRTALRKLISDLDSDKVMKKPDPSQPQSNDDNGLISMSTSVKVPGKVIETDGEHDPISGEVFWSLFPEASQLGPVTVRVVCETN